MSTQGSKTPGYWATKGEYQIDQKWVVWTIPNGRFVFSYYWVYPHCRCSMERLTASHIFMILGTLTTWGLINPWLTLASVEWFLAWSDWSFLFKSWAVGRSQTCSLTIDDSYWLPSGIRTVCSRKWSCISLIHLRITGNVPFFLCTDWISQAAKGSSNAAEIWCPGVPVHGHQEHLLQHDHQPLVPNPRWTRWLDSMGWYPAGRLILMRFRINFRWCVGEHDLGA